MSSSHVEVLHTRSAFSTDGAIIAVEGEIDVETMTMLAGQCSQMALEGPLRVTVDLSRLRVLAPEEITSILRGVQRLRAAGADLVIRYPEPTEAQLSELRSSIRAVAAGPDRRSLPSA